MIPETEQWLLDGNCDKCRKDKYCDKDCSAYKKAIKKAMKEAYEKIMKKAKEKWDEEHKDTNTDNNIPTDSAENNNIIEGETTNEQDSTV